jgi:hypothetical protein
LSEPGQRCPGFSFSPSSFSGKLIALQILHLVELLQELFSLFSTDWAHIIERGPV